MIEQSSRGYWHISSKVLVLYISGWRDTVKLMAPQFVKPYVKSNKNDARDAEAICEAVSRPNMRFVALKTAEQQALVAIHRARQRFVEYQSFWIRMSRHTPKSIPVKGLLPDVVG